MPKKSICILAILFLLTLCPACSTANATDYSPTETKENLVVSPDSIGFEEVASYSCYDEVYEGRITYTYYRCRTTNAMYVWLQYDENLVNTIRPYSGFTAMLDPETGGPLTYENWLAYLEANSQKTGE